MHSGSLSGRERGNHSTVKQSDPMYFGNYSIQKIAKG